MLMPILRQFAAGLVLVSLIAAQATALLEARHDDGHASSVGDAACLGPASTPGTHHEAGAQFETPIPAQPIDHCAFCHLQRAFSNARPGNTDSTFLPPLAAVAGRDAFVALASGARPEFAPRGPPASL
jgi:uncharacterized protein involved in copper resistance